MLIHAGVHAFAGGGILMDRKHIMTNASTLVCTGCHRSFPNFHGEETCGD